MIAWAGGDGVRRRRGYPVITDSTYSSYIDATDSGTATCTTGPDEYYIVSWSGEGGIANTLLEAIKALRPPVVHERQMNLRASREYVIPHNRKLLMQQFKQSRRV